MSSGAGTDCLEPFSGLGASDVALRAATSDELQDNGQAICKHVLQAQVSEHNRGLSVQFQHRHRLFGPAGCLYRLNGVLLPDNVEAFEQLLNMVLLHG